MSNLKAAVNAALNLKNEQLQAHTKRALRPAQVAEKFGVSVPTVWRYARNDPSFPKKTKLSERVSVFDEQELDAWHDGKRTAA